MNCSFRWKQYYKQSEESDHDHCGACWAKFMIAEGCLTEGYAVSEEYEHGADYVWICKTCFEDLKMHMNWKVIE